MNIGRVLRTLGAHGFGQAITILSTILIPAIAIRNIGADSYGIILTITGITQLMLLADLGVTMALANHICLLSEGQQAEAKLIAAQTKKLATKYVLITLSTFALILCVYYFLNLRQTDGGLEIALCCLLFAINSALQPTVNVYSAAQRHQGKPDKAIYFINIGRLFELVTYVVAYTLFNNIAVIALIALVIRILYSSIAIAKANKYFDEFPAAVTNSSVQEVASAGRGLALTASIQHLTLHAPVLLISALISPTLAAVYSSTRTLSRVAIQPIGIGLASIQHELTLYWGRNEFKTFKKLAFFAMAGSTALLIATSVFTFFFLSEINVTWLSDKIHLPPALFVPVAVSATAQSAILAISLSLSSINKTQRLSRLLLLATLISLAAAYLTLVNTTNVVAMSYVLAFGEVALVPLLLRELRNLSTTR
ncbi:lipopolysaccharide biosynthesis protein [Rhodoferax sp. BLA1]|uniref:lipopolysaccharide biosynthesis protein n=1 Tax=Rhodoferax sp. BLA1 TaxID=2576062 RepID=UPI0015D11D97|nr:hypothetical protein [Rhodoferax sp. BLA1]